MSRKILILANSSSGLYGFRRELLAGILEKGQVYASIPNNGYFEDLEKLGCRIVETPIDRRGINPLTDMKLFACYLKMLRQHKPDMVITYTIKPNVYGGLACRLRGNCVERIAAL